MKRVVQTSDGNQAFKYEKKICHGLYVTQAPEQLIYNLNHFEINQGEDRQPTVFQKRSKACIIDHINDPMTRIQFLVERDCNLKEVPLKLHQIISPAIQIAKTKDMEKYARELQTLATKPAE